MDKTVDLLVVGQGLAGSLLAWRLLQAGMDVVVVADAAGAPTSRTAAGLVNPVTGQRLVKAINVDVLLPAARRFYRHLEQIFERPLFHEKAMLRLFRTEKEQEVYEKRCHDPAYQPYLGERFDSGGSGCELNDPLGGFRQYRTGYLDTTALLDTLNNYFLQQGRYLEGTVEYAALQLLEDGVVWEGLKAGRLIFCEGYLGQANPWFDWLPFQPAKGEILTLRTAERLPSEIINGRNWLVPTGGGEFKLGATYQWQPLDVQPTQAGRQQLLEGLALLLAHPPDCELIDHGAGVRPGTRDKLPFIGLHPECPVLGIFNGFGSKGSLMVPWYADRFSRYLQEGEPLPPEADIARFGYE